MTYQDRIWKGKTVWVVSIMSKQGRIHRYLKKYIGRGGYVLGTSKNNMLLIEFGSTSSKSRHTRSIPASCVTLYGTKQIF